MNRRLLFVSSSLLGIAVASPALAGSITVTRDLPVLDQWVYPFASSPGGAFAASVFSSQLEDGFSDLFDNRDGQALVAFDLTGAIPGDVDPGTLTLASATLTMRTATANTFMYDPTPDPYTSWLLPDDPDFTPDADPGRAVEVFGVKFRNGLNVANFTENIPYSFSGPFGQGVRNAYPFSFNAPTADFDVSNNVSAGFDPDAFAAGTIPELSPGDVVPLNTDIEFALDVADPDIAAYVAASLDSGRLFLIVASLFVTEQMGSGTFPSFYTKENPQVSGGAQEAGRLTLVFDIAVPGDLNGDGTVDGADLGILLSAWGACPAEGDCPADLDGSGEVDGADLGALLAAWS